MLTAAGLSLRALAAAASRTGDNVTVTGRSIPVVPGLPTAPIRATASGAVETTH